MSTESRHLPSVSTLALLSANKLLEQDLSETVTAVAGDKRKIPTNEPKSTRSLIHDILHYPKQRIISHVIITTKDGRKSFHKFFDFGRQFPILKFYR